MKRLGQYVSPAVKSLKAEKAVELHRLKSAWLDAVGPFLGHQTEPVKLQAQVLYLVVSSSVWAQEISLQQPLILKKLSQHFSRPPKKIVCWVGEVHAKVERPKAVEGEPEELVPWKNLEIPDERAANIEQTVQTVTEPKLQSLMRNLLTLAVQRELYHLNLGLLPCPLCGQFRDPDQEQCLDCRREQIALEENKVLRLLAQKPWLTAKEAAERVRLKDKATFSRLRKSLLANWMQQAWQRSDGLEGDSLIQNMDCDLRSLLLEITMLRCSLPAQNLQPRHFYFALGKRLAAGYLAETKAE